MAPLNPSTLPTDEVETRLHALAGMVPWPATPDVVAGALARIRTGPPVTAPGARGVRSSVARHGRVVALALLALLIAAAVAAAAIIGLPGLRLGFTETLPSPQVPDDSTQVRRSLGDRADLAAAWSALEDGLLVPDVLGEPDEVYVGSAGSRPRVALVYRADGGGPPLMGDIALIVTEWGGALDADYARKWLQMPDGHAEQVRVDGTRGYWVSGMPHVLEYLDDQSGIRRPVTRLVGDVLVWQAGSVVYRIESPLGRDTTLAIAGSMTDTLFSPPPTARPRPRAPGPWPR